MNHRDLLHKAKQSAGLSIRDLSGRARVATSTITRIQAGTVEPTIETLARIFTAAGFELRLGLVRRGTRRGPWLGALADAWTRRNGRVRLDWTRWRTLFDELALHPELTPEAIYEAPPPSGESIIDAVLAGSAEKLADDANLPRPTWTSTIPSLAEPYDPPVARPRIDRVIPPQFKARGVLIDTESLWRNPMTIGV